MRTGKISLLCLAFVGGVPTPLVGQLQIPRSLSTGEALAVSQRAADFAGDLSVPMSPAFALLGQAPTTILRPSSTRELAANLSSFLDSKGGVAVPRDFGLEFSPALLFAGSGLTLADYRDNQLLNRFRLSVATSRKEGGEDASPTRLAVGFRLALQDKSDLRTNMAFVNEVTALATRANEIYSAARRRIGNPALAPDPLVLMADESSQIEALNDSIRAAWEALAWNEPVFDIAGSMRMTARGPDSDSLSVDRWAAWVLRGVPMGDQGQLLLGLTATGERDVETDLFKNRLDLTARAYMGSNVARLFGEAQFRFADDQRDAFVLNGGGDFRFMEGSWATISVGVVRDRAGGGSELVSGLDFRLGLPNP